ncbi:TetR family transcriptional regulator [Micromonospora sp. Llam7]|uniref:acyl-CoA-like ligand-binding transcription factor n=1 Tax=Micromonospora tarapacensis TaxID=2835305 RepID=UPI001C82CB15|nr:TetR family transcriptional regulator [Micromonospora tarapacensis]MBX7266264.1 TetR family transcriptional regulator [Micromonospora tarapacensis]
MDPNPATRGVRARARQAMRAEVATVVQDLVLERGYEETTVDDICAAAEISRSTFFRYFPSKEEALFGESVDAGERLRDALTARPPGEAPWVAMRRALDSLIEQYEAHDERTRRLTRLIVNTPSLAARHREKNARWQELLRPEIARRLGADSADDSDPRANAVIAAALGCVEAALTAWTANAQPQTLAKILDRAMQAPSHLQ